MLLPSLYIYIHRESRTLKLLGSVIEKHMEGLPFLRQLIGQLQEPYAFNDPNPNTTLPFQPSSIPFVFQVPQNEPLRSRQARRWCFLHIDDNSVENCRSLLMTAGKPANFKMVESVKPPPLKRSRKERHKGKSSGTLCTSEVMDEDIWKNLPEDLFEAVIARLPIATLFRFRTVCMRWNSLLTSQSFAQHFSEVPRKNPWFYTMCHENAACGTLYDPSSKKWHHLTESMLPSKLVIFPLASAGGLVCFHDLGHRNIYICNPLTRSHRKLPPRSGSVLPHAVLGMTRCGHATSASAGYRVLWVGCNGEYEVYDSLKNSWSNPVRTPSSIKLPLLLCLRSQPVSIDSIVIWLRSDPVGLVSYDTTSGIWKEFTVPAPLHSSDHSLAVCDGRILLVGLLTKNAATCVYIWELQKMTLLWKEVDRMPNIWCLDFYGKHIRMNCLGNTGLLLLLMRSKQMNRLVTYNVASREWTKVPGCVLPSGRKRQLMGCGTAFHPCPTAMA